MIREKAIHINQRKYECSKLIKDKCDQCIDKKDSYYF